MSCVFVPPLMPSVTPHKVDRPASEEEVRETHASSSLTTAGPMHFVWLKNSAPPPPHKPAAKLGLQLIATCVAPLLVI